VRLVLAASFRAGAIYVERPTPSGPAPLYDYKDSYDLFAKINTFKHVTFRVAETRLSVDQIKRANRELIAMGVTGTPESGNAIAAAVRKLGEPLKAGIQEANTHADRGLPIRDAVLGGSGALAEPTTAKDPTKVVTAFLSHAAEWKSLHLSLESLRAFLADQRHHEYDTSRRIAELATNHPVDSNHGSQALLERSLKDMNAIIAEKSVWRGGLITASPTTTRTGRIETPTAKRTHSSNKKQGAWRLRSGAVPPTRQRRRQRVTAW
jgi:hypothetical protein